MSGSAPKADIRIPVPKSEIHENTCSASSTFDDELWVFLWKFAYSSK